MKKDTSRIISRDDPAHRGQSEYTPSFLRVYDRLVLGVFTTFVWRCPSRRIVDHYNQHLQQRHLDVGPGTGYFLRHATRPDGFELTLADPNRYVLAHAARRLRDLEPELVEANVLEPLPVEGPFDSAAMNFVLHCLPGPMPAKAPAVRHVAATLTPEGTLFGATIICDDEHHNALSRALMRSNNRRRIFGNADDSIASLHDTLDASFTTVDITVVGTVAVFAAHGPR